MHFSHRVAIIGSKRGQQGATSQAMVHVENYRNKNQILLFSSIEYLKVVVRAEILPRDFLQTLGNYYLWLTEANIQRSKNFTVKKFVQFLKALALKLSVFKIKVLPTQRIW